MTTYTQFLARKTARIALDKLAYAMTAPYALASDAPNAQM